MRLTPPADSIPASANKYLLPEERQVVTFRQHPAKLLPPLTAAVGGLLAAVAVSVISNRVTSAHYVVWALAAFVVIDYIPYPEQIYLEIYPPALPG